MMRSSEEKREKTAKTSHNPHDTSKNTSNNHFNVGKIAFSGLMAEAIPSIAKEIERRLRITIPFSVVKRTQKYVTQINTPDTESLPQLIAILLVSHHTGYKLEETVRKAEEIISEYMEKNYKWKYWKKKKKEKKDREKNKETRQEEIRELKKTEQLINEIVSEIEKEIDNEEEKSEEEPTNGEEPSPNNKQRTNRQTRKPTNKRRGNKKKLAKRIETAEDRMMKIVDKVRNNLEQQYGLIEDMEELLSFLNNTNTAKNKDAVKTLEKQLKKFLNNYQEKRGAPPKNRNEDHTLRRKLREKINQEDPKKIIAENIVFYSIPYTNNRFMENKLLESMVGTIMAIDDMIKLGNNANNYWKKLSEKRLETERKLSKTTQHTPPARNKHHQQTNQEKTSDNTGKNNYEPKQAINKQRNNRRSTNKEPRQGLGQGTSIEETIRQASENLKQYEKNKIPSITKGMNITINKKTYYNEKNDSWYMNKYYNISTKDDNGNPHNGWFSTRQTTTELELDAEQILKDVNNSLKKTLRKTRTNKNRHIQKNNANNAKNNTVNDAEERTHTNKLGKHFTTTAKTPLKINTKMDMEDVALVYETFSKWLKTDRYSETVQEYLHNIIPKTINDKNMTLANEQSEKMLKAYTETIANTLDDVLNRNIEPGRYAEKRQQLLTPLGDIYEEYQRELLKQAIKGNKEHVEMIDKILGKTQNTSKNTRQKIMEFLEEKERASRKYSELVEHLKRLPTPVLEKANQSIVMNDEKAKETLFITIANVINEQREYSKNMRVKKTKKIDVKRTLKKMFKNASKLIEIDMEKQSKEEPTVLLVIDTSGSVRREVPNILKLTDRLSKDIETFFMTTKLIPVKNKQLTIEDAIGFTDFREAFKDACKKIKHEYKDVLLVSDFSHTPDSWMVREEQEALYKCIARKTDRTWLVDYGDENNWGHRGEKYEEYLKNKGIYVKRIHSPDFVTAMLSATTLLSENT